MRITFQVVRCRTIIKFQNNACELMNFHTFCSFIEPSQVNRLEKNEIYMTNVLKLLTLIINSIIVLPVPHRACNCNYCNVFKGTKWAVFGGKRIHSTLYWKGSIVSAGIRTPIHGLRSERSTPELTDLLMNGHKIAYIKYIIRCLQIDQVYAIVIKWQIVNSFEQNAV